MCHQRRCFVAKHDGEVGAEPMREVVNRGGRGSNERGLGRAREVRVEATMLYWFRKCVTCDGAPMRNTTTRSSGAHERGGDEGREGLQQSNPMASSVTSTTRQPEDHGENEGRMETRSGSASLERDRLWLDCVLEGSGRKETTYEEISK